MEASLYEELDEAKAEVEKLREQCRVKAELAENLKKSYVDQQSKFKEASSKLERLIQELNEKEDAVSTAESANEELRSSLEQKEATIKNLVSANDKLRVDFNAKVSGWEEGNKALALALDDANAKNVGLEQQMVALKQEVEGVKRLLSVSQKNCSESESKVCRELGSREDAIFEIEEENRKLQDQLKWKIEQFGHLKEAHDKLLSQFRMKEMEWENNGKALDLDSGNCEIDQEQRISELEKEIEGLKRVLTISNKKCSEMESKAKAERGGRDDVFSKLEEENKKFEDQLKWKKEQFDHLKEAHEKLRSEFKTKEKEWKKEKTGLLDGISSLEAKLESQIRTSKDLQSRFEMCNQALAHAESKRKVLEVELFECKKKFDSMCDEYEAAKSTLNINAQRDQEIASLRSLLATRDVLYKEMEYQFRRMEQEKQDVMFSLKELQEDRIQEAGVVSSSSKIRSKLKSLEQVHKGCLANLQAKESEWRSEMEKLTEELNFCKLESESKDAYLNELKDELEACDSLILKLEMLNQESSLMLLILKSEFAEKMSYLDMQSKEVEENNITGLVEDLEIKKAAFNTVQKDLEEEREKVVVLTETVRTLKELQLPLQNEVNRLKQKLEESTTNGLNSEEEIMQIKSDLEKVRDALDRANAELDLKFCEANEIEFELQIWRSVARQLEVNLMQSTQLRKEVEDSLFSQTEVEVNLKEENERLDRLVDEKDNRIENLQQQLAELNESLKAENEFESEPQAKEDLHQLVEEKDQRISDLQRHVANLEEEFNSSTSMFSSNLSLMQEETNLLRESLEKNKADGLLKEVEIQEKNLMIVELESDLSSLLQRVEQQEVEIQEKNRMIVELESDLSSLLQRVEQQDITALCSQQKVLEIQAELERERLQVHKLESELEEKKQLVNNMSLLSERMQQLHSSIVDTQLSDHLAKIVQIVVDDDDEHDPVKENISCFSSPLMKKAETVQAERSPLKSINTATTKPLLRI